MKNVRRCINLDWLEVYCLEPILDEKRDAQYYMQQGFQVDVRPYGTRSYRQMFTLLDQDGLPFIEVRREPIGMFSNGDINHCDPNGCHVRLVNRYCYADNAAALMAEFISRYGLIFVRIAKVDVALDFERFDLGDYPQKFLSRYMAGKYSKINQSNISAYGKDAWDGRKWSSVSWGADRSPVLTRFYNKTKEIEEVHDKPYIRQAWAICGLISDPVTMQKQNEAGEWYKPSIWRVEFSIRSSVKRWVTIESEKGKGKKKLSFANTLDVYDGRDKILKMFASLAAHYFHFKYYQEGVSKYKAEDKQLFSFKYNDYYKVGKVASSRPRSEIIDRLIRLLHTFTIVHFERKINNAANLLIDDLRELQLKRMAIHPWDESEVQLLRQLISRRIENPSEPFSVSKEVAESFVELEFTLWKEFEGNEAS